MVTLSPEFTFPREVLVASASERIFTLVSFTVPGVSAFAVMGKRKRQTKRTANAEIPFFHIFFLLINFIC